MIQEDFFSRHIGPRASELAAMSSTIGVSGVDELIDQVIPRDIRLREPLALEDPLTEHEYLAHIREIATKNKIFRSFIGMGYYETLTPSVILRNVFENPGWYTSYTPYQAEISQGRLEALLNFQTVITELTGMEISNCSLLDEGTSAAEAMSMMFAIRSRQAIKDGKNILFVDSDIFPQTLDVIQLRAEPRNIKVVVGKYDEFDFNDKVFGAILQYPAASGKINDYSDFTTKAHAADIMVTAVVDIMSLILLKSPASWGADIAVGTTQRLGIPMGYGGPAAGFLATANKYKRNMPGRIIGISIDRYGNKAYRMALQTREQHIKREKATSNICTAQALLAIMSGFYVAYHGPEGMKRIANNIHSAAQFIADRLVKFGYKVEHEKFFDTIRVAMPENVKIDDIRELALARNINFNYFYDGFVGISTDEVITDDEVCTIISLFARATDKTYIPAREIPIINMYPEFARTDSILQQHVFNSYHSETEMMRYIKCLENRDIALNRSMISLGSCTMKLNPATTMLPLSWPEMSNIHPFAPLDQAAGYQELLSDAEAMMSIITDFAATSFQPNSGATGENAGLMVIREYHKSRDQRQRNVCIIPTSAHGTNPASAAMAGMSIVLVDCDAHGNVDIDDLRSKASSNKDKLACMMITYPSTHGVFESRIREIVDIIHSNGGLVYMDGANMNAQVGLTNPGFIGADVCHLNLHKTFAIPHGGGGPGIGSISVTAELKEFLPQHTVIETGGFRGIHAITSAPYGSAFILPITYGYVRMMGDIGLTNATKMAIFNANYLANALKGVYDVVYTGETGRCAHEMILDVRKFRQEYGVDAGDIAHRLMDYGFHAPTLSFPVHETLMVEPTESESKQELDRFVETLKAIKQECEDIKAGRLDKDDNPIKNAPHTQAECCASEWHHKYSREQAAFPLPWIKENKFWPYVGKIDNGYGDRNLVCKVEE